MALQELGVATEIVTTAFAILFGAIALALSLAFGLGNRELAGEVTRNWYRRYKEERETIERDNRELDKIEGITSNEEYVRPTGIRHSGPHDVFARPSERQSPRASPEPERAVKLRKLAQSAVAPRCDSSRPDRHRHRRLSQDGADGAARRKPHQGIARLGLRPDFSRSPAR